MPCNAFPTTRTCVRAKPRSQWLSQLSRGSCCFLTLPSHNENSSIRVSEPARSQHYPSDALGADENKPHPPFGEENCFKIKLYNGNKRCTRWFPWRSGWLLLTASSSPATFVQCGRGICSLWGRGSHSGWTVRTWGAEMDLAVIVTSTDGPALSLLRSTVWCEFSAKSQTKRIGRKPARIQQQNKINK